MTCSDSLDLRVQVIDWIQVVTDNDLDFRGLISEHSGLKKEENRLYVNLISSVPLL